MVQYDGPWQRKVFFAAYFHLCAINFPLWPAFMLCVGESCLNVPYTGKQTQTVSRKYRKQANKTKNTHPKNIKNTHKTTLGNKTKNNKNKTILKDSWLDPPFPQDFPRIVFLLFFGFPMCFFLLFLGCYWFS